MNSNCAQVQEVVFADFVEVYPSGGGPEEPFLRFIREATWAYKALSLYKAALYRDEKKLKEELGLERSVQRGPGMRVIESFREEVEEIKREVLTEKNARRRVDMLVDMATQRVTTVVNRVLTRYTYPCLTFNLSGRLKAESDTLQSPQSLTASLWPRNLLGAMYLQFYWFITSESELSYCQHCGKPISHAPLMPGSGIRKTYKNKKYCSKQCRQNYYYHHRRKHRRQGT